MSFISFYVFQVLNIDEKVYTHAMEWVLMFSIAVA